MINATFQGGKLLIGKESWPIKYLDEGARSTIYTITGGRNKGKILAAVDPADDWSKEMVADINSRTRNKHLPATKYIGRSEDRALYMMPRYTVGPPEGSEAYRDMLAIQQCHHDEWNAVRRELWPRIVSLVRRGHSEHEAASRVMRNRGSDIMIRVGGCVQRHKLKPSLSKALMLLSEEALRYGVDYHFEFQPFNMAVDDKGNLILLDVIYQEG